MVGRNLEGVQLPGGSDSRDGTRVVCDEVGGGGG